VTKATCNDLEFSCPATGKPLPYVGREVPKWCQEGVKVRVKTTPNTRAGNRNSRGIRVSRSWNADDCALWAGDIGTITRRVRPHPTQAEVDAGECWYGGKPYVAGEGGWWDWSIEFSRGRVWFPSSVEDWNQFAKVKPVATTDE
jgi:hypothetical protein